MNVKSIPAGCHIYAVFLLRLASVSGNLILTHVVILVDFQIPIEAGSLHSKTGFQSFESPHQEMLPIELITNLV